MSTQSNFAAMDQYMSLLMRLGVRHTTLYMVWL